MILKSVQKLQVILAGAITTSQLPITASWADMLADASTLAPDGTDAATNSTTAVDVVAAPASGYKRQLKSFTVHNADTAPATVTIRIDNAGTARIVAKIVLAVGYRVEYQPGAGFQVFDTAGALVTVATITPPGGESIAEPVSVLASASGVLSINCALGDYFTLTLSENVTSITFTNLPATGKAQTVMVRIQQHASSAKTMAFPSSFKWAVGSTPTVSTVLSAYDVLALTTFDQGTRWEATLSKAHA